MRQMEITWCKWGQALPPHSNLEVQNNFSVNFIEGKKEICRRLALCPSIMNSFGRNQTMSSLCSHITNCVFIKCVPPKKYLPLFQWLHNARLEGGRWTNLTSGVMWQILLWFNCCLGGIGGRVWHNNIRENNGHLVYIEAFFLWFQSKFQA